jgi:hypothetical protein
MQYIKHNHIIGTLTKHKILDYHRYVDDILMVYNEDHTDIDDTLKEFNSIHPNIQYTIEEENQSHEFQHIKTILQKITTQQIHT